MPSQPNKPAPSTLPALLALGAAICILALTILATPDGPVFGVREIAPIEPFAP